jgi:hypothetical protein
VKGGGRWAVAYTPFGNLLRFERFRSLREARKWARRFAAGEPCRRAWVCRWRRDRAYGFWIMEPSIIMQPSWHTAPASLFKEVMVLFQNHRDH